MQQPHLPASRKDTILILVLVGWMVCGLASIASFYMAKQDLEQIDAGMMDGRDREQLNMMKIISLVHIGLMSLAIVGFCCWMGLGMAMAGASAGGGGY